jgi:hypothetical protein
MDTRTLSESLVTLFSELADGAPPNRGCYMLNRGDPGMLASLDKLSAVAASTVVAGGSSIAAHVAHVRYGLSLLNQWRPGRNPFATADWTASWRRTRVTATEWKELRARLRDEARRWMDALRSLPEMLPDMSVVELSGVIGSIAHVAYHLGAIRQMDRSIRGPSAEEEPRAEQVPS